MEINSPLFCVPPLLLGWITVISLLYALVIKLARHVSEPVQVEIIYQGFKMVHGTIAFLLNTHGTIATLTSAPLSQEWTQLIILVSITFYTLDSVVGYSIGVKYGFMNQHHLVTVVLMIGSLYHQDNHLYFPTLMLLQVANPPKHLKQILRLLGLRSTRLFELTELVFLYLFLLARAGFCPLMVYVMLVVKNTSIILYVSASLLILLSVHLWLQAYRKLSRRWRQEKSIGQKDIPNGRVDCDHPASDKEIDCLSKVCQ